MRVVGFCEGARADSGGVGLIGVPLIHQAFANRGHRSALVVGGQPMPSAEPMLCQNFGEVFERRTDGGAVGVLAFPAVGRWSFSPWLMGSATRAVERADFVTLHSMYSYPVLAGFMLAQHFKKPFGLWPHGVFAQVQRQVGKQKKAIYGALVAHRILNAASVLFFSAEGERREAEALGLTTPSVVIPHGIDTAPFANLPPRGRFRDQFVGGHRGPLVLYLGRLNAKKGLDVLIEAMALVVRDIPDARLVIAGGGDPPPFTELVRGWVARAGVQHATVLTGILDQRDKITAFADADLFVMPSVAENFGFAMFEAMASQRPVVCSDTVDYAGEVQRFGAGVAVERTPVKFAEVISALLRDSERRAALGRNGAKLAEQFSWEACGRLVEATVDAILNGRPFPSSLSPQHIGVTT